MSNHFVVSFVLLFSKIFLETSGKGKKTRCLQLTRVDGFSSKALAPAAGHVSWPGGGELGSRPFPVVGKSRNSMARPKA